MNLAEGSLEESRYYLILARDLGYGDTATLLNHLEEVSRMLSAYAAAILSPDGSPETLSAVYATLPSTTCKPSDKAFCFRKTI